MDEATVRPAPRAVRVVLAVVLAAGILTVGAGEVRARLPWPEREVALPAVTASPQEVVRTYVDALDARDIDTAKALSTPEQVAQSAGAVDSWYRNVISIKNLEILAPWREGVSGERAETYSEAIFVPVHFDLRLRRQTTMDNGRTRWGYLLVRRSPADRWLVDDQGPV